MRKNLPPPFDTMTLDQLDKCSRDLKALKITGTFGNLVVLYRVGKKIRGRIKHSITREMVLNNKEFALTRQHADVLGQASGIASAVYRTLPPGCKSRPLYQKLVGIAIRSLREGNETEGVENALKVALRDMGYIPGLPV